MKASVVQKKRERQMFFLDKMFILYIISAQVVPVLVPEPVPEVQVGASGVRAVPEVTAFAPQVLIRGNAPLPYGDSPRRPI